MSESEKITINLGAVDLGKIDLLVHEGVYSNRTDFIRSSIRSQIEKHGLELQQSMRRHAFLVGLIWLDRKSLERRKAKGERVDLRVLGSLILDGDIPPELASEVIERVHVRGIFKASQAVKDALGERVQ